VECDHGQREHRDADAAPPSPSSGRDGLQRALRARQATAVM